MAPAPELPVLGARARVKIPERELHHASKPCGAGDLRVAAQIRHRHQPAPATVQSLEQGRAAAEFDTPQVAITPGQAVVFYDDDVVLGGGWID